MHPVAIIQARMGSTRLPGKVMLDLEGHTMLARVVQRVRRAQHISQVVVATTFEPEARSILDECERLGVACVQGSTDDVLDRYYQTARRHHATAVIRITSDCPLIDPEVIDLVIDAFTGQK